MIAFSRVKIMALLLAAVAILAQRQSEYCPELVEQGTSQYNQRK